MSSGVKPRRSRSIPPNLRQLQTNVGCKPPRPLPDRVYPAAGARDAAEGYRSDSNDSSYLPCLFHGSRSAEVGFPFMIDTMGRSKVLPSRRKRHETENRTVPQLGTFNQPCLPSEPAKSKVWWHTQVRREAPEGLTCRDECQTDPQPPTVTGKSRTSERMFCTFWKYQGLLEGRFELQRRATRETPCQTVTGHRDSETPSKARRP